MKDYKLLTKSAKYDKKAVEELTELLKETNELQNRLDYLRELVDENSELRGYVWVTSTKEPIAIHNLSDNHLTIILRNIVRNDNTVPREIRAEARSRSISIPSGGEYLELDSPDDYYDWDNEV